MSSDQTTPAPQNGAATDRESAAIAKDDAFHFLQDPRRRATLRYLLDHDDRDQFRMRDVAEEVAAWEHDTTVQALTSTERQRVYIALYQSHLPKLDEHDIIEYNQGRGTIEPTPRIYALAPFLEEGLHGATEHFTVEDKGPAATDSRPGLATTITAFFTTESE